MKAITTLLFMLLPCTLWSAEEFHAQYPFQVPRATDLYQDGQTAKKHSLGIMLLISQEDCSYCELIKHQIIGPMIRSGNYKGRLLIREVMIDGGEELIDFQGKARQNQEFAFSYQAGLTPTLLFVDAEGRQLAPKMIGIQTPEMYYYYVEESIEKALKKLNSDKES